MLSIFDQLPGYIGWKDAELNYLGCNRNLAQVLALNNTASIVGRNDADLIDHTPESSLFHYQNDLMVLKGKTISGIHEAVGVYSDTHYYFVKKPLYTTENKICGVIYHCQEYKPSHLVLQLLQHVPSQNLTTSIPDNKFGLSNRELECLFYTLRGKTARQIADIMALSKRTVESYLETIKNKIGCANKADLLVAAVSHGYMNYIPQHLL